MIKKFRKERKPKFQVLKISIRLYYRVKLCKHHSAGSYGCEGSAQIVKATNRGQDSV